MHGGTWPSLRCDAGATINALARFAEAPKSPLLMGFDGAASVPTFLSLKQRHTGIHLGRAHLPYPAGTLDAGDFVRQFQTYRGRGIAKGCGAAAE